MLDDEIDVVAVGDGGTPVACFADG